MLIFKNIYISFLLLTLTACAAKPRLSYASPISVNLTGVWHLNEASSQTVVMVPAGRGKGKNGPPPGGGKGPKGGGPSGGPPPHIDGKDDPGLRGKPASMIVTQMRIEQGVDGMGVAYPKHRYRDIDWGTFKIRRAEVTAGWNDNGALVILTKDDRQKFTERYKLDSTGDVLTITFTVNSFKGEQDYVRIFDRVKDN